MSRDLTDQLERRLAIPGLLNFRDVGGYRTTEGRSVRRGLLYRSEALDALDSEGRRAVAALGVRTIVDLRGPAEDPKPPQVTGAEIVPVPIHAPAIGERQFAESVARGEIRLDTPVVGWLHDAYEGYLRDAGRAFVQTVEAVSTQSRLPAVVHCNAGKDRTGLVVALILAVLGVDRQTILDDYVLTTSYRSDARVEELRPLFAAHGKDIDDIRVLYDAPPEVLTAALDIIHEQHGGAEQYLRANGLGTDALARLRALLLEPDGAEGCP